MSTRPKPFLTPEQYLVSERAGDQKHEYYQGEVFAMVGASFSHVGIAANLLASLHGQLQSGPCRVFSSDLRVKVSRTGLYTYPDIGVVCDQPQFDDDQKDTLLNPRVIIEVLSPSTESYDRGKKFAHYRTVESLAEYLLVSQDQTRIEQYVRQPTHDWLLHEATEPAETIHLPSIECDLKLSDVYANIDLSQPE
jgi:Uma2 family endonuclease